MVQNVDIVNRALQTLGTRTTVSTAELANNTSNEAIQANLILEEYRDSLLRMAPWDSGIKHINLTYITSAPGTPENQTAQTTLWQPGQPSPPWAYEYQYPVDCLRACWIIPATQTGFAGGVPITTAVTGGAPSFWQGPPVKFKVQNDQFYPVIAAAPVAGGTGYAINDVITLAAGPNTSNPIGAPAQLVVTGTGAGGSVTSVVVVAQIYASSPNAGGSYFQVLSAPQAQGSTTGSGSGATFSLTFGSQGDQRVIVTNQEFATLGYVKRITDPNVMDPQFQKAWSHVLGGGLAMALTGDKKLANYQVQLANQIIEQARVSDGNEGFTVNDITPDFLRIRGIAFPEPYSGPFGGFDWGSLWPVFG